MKFNRSILTALMSVAVIQTAVFAEKPGIEAHQILLTQNVEVSITNAEPNAAISVRITDENGEKDFYEMGYANAEGSFSFNYVNDRHTGEMKVEARVGAEKVIGSYYMMSDAAYGEFVAAMTAQQGLQGTEEADGQSIKDVFDKYDGKFSFEKKAYDNLSEEGKNNVYKNMANDTSFNGKVAGFNDVLSSFYASVLKEAYKNDKKSLETMSQMSPYKAVIDSYAPVLSSSIKKVSAATLQKVFVAVNANADIEKVLKDIEFGIFQKVVSEDGTWSEVKDMFTLYKGELNIDPNTADVNVYKALVKTPLYSSYSDYAQAFRNRVNSPIVSGPGGGGPVGGGPVGGVVAPIIANNSSKQDTTASDSSAGDLVFSDLTEAMWAIKAVTYVYEKGIISGVGDGRFEPNRTVTRAEAVKMIVSMMGYEAEGSVSFDDVKEGDWFYPYIAAAYEHGIVSGKTEKLFDPYSLVSRQEMAVMAYNAIKESGGETANAGSVNIVDEAAIAPWALEAVQYLYEKNIIAGRLGSIFDPLDNMTRAESATVIYNIIK